MFFGTKLTRSDRGLVNGSNANGGSHSQSQRLGTSASADINDDGGSGKSRKLSGSDLLQASSDRTLMNDISNGAGSTTPVMHAKYKTLPRLDSTYKDSFRELFSPNNVSPQKHSQSSSSATARASGELLGLTLSLTIPYTQVGATKQGKIFTQYVIALTLPPPASSAPNTPAKEWIIKRRYSQFVELDKQLRQSLGQDKNGKQKTSPSHQASSAMSKLANLPPKRFLNTFEDSVIHERKHGLSEYLHSALMAVRENDESASLLAIFLELPGSKPYVHKDPVITPALSSPGILKESTAQIVLSPDGVEQAHHGFVYKFRNQGLTYQSKPFKLSFCVLTFDDKMFRFYRTSRPQLLGAVFLGKADSTVEIVLPGEMAVPEDGFGIYLFTPERELILYCETLEDRQSWMDAFKRVIPASGTQQSRPSISPSPVPLSAPTSSNVTTTTTSKPVRSGSSAATSVTTSATTSKSSSTQQQQPTAVKRNIVGGTPVQLAERELAKITSIREDWAIDWQDLDILEKVGGGAFGTVYRGKCWGSIVAVKQLNTSGEITQELKLALEKEVGVLSKLRHPNVVLYIGASFTSTNAAMVTEWCENKSLFDLLQNRGTILDSSLMLKFAMQIARGMGYLHSRREQIIHRDLKSLNVLITEGMDCKVADFGLTVMREATAVSSSAAAPKPQRSDTNLSLFSNSGADFFGIEGTAQYMAPEVMEGGRYNHKVDVYSYGVLLTELLARKMPFKDLYAGFDFVDAVIDRAERPTIPFWASTITSPSPPTTASATTTELEDDGIASSSSSSASPSEMGDLVMKCTNRDPSSRPDFKQIIQKLETLETLDEQELFCNFDLPRIRELMDMGDVDDLYNAAEELYELSNQALLYQEDRDYSIVKSRNPNAGKKAALIRFIQSSNLIQCMLNRIAYGKASKLVEKGGEYETVDIPIQCLVNLVCACKHLIHLSADPVVMLQLLYVPKKDSLISLAELFLRIDLPQRGVDACGTLLSEFRSSSTKLRGVFDEIMESKLDEVFDDKRNPLLLGSVVNAVGSYSPASNRRRTMIVSEKENILWRCRTYDVLPNKYQKQKSVFAGANGTILKDEVRALESEVRSMEAALATKRRQLMEAVKKGVHKDVGKV